MLAIRLSQSIEKRFAKQARGLRHPPARKLRTQTLCLVFALGTCTAYAAIGNSIQNNQVRLASQQISPFEAHNITRLEALIQLAQAKHLPLAIDGTDRELLSGTVDFFSARATVGSILATIFKGSHGFAWTEANGVLSISKKSERKEDRQNPFDRVIPEFRASSATVEQLSNLLRMDLELLDNPGPGFAGTFPAGTSRELPPFDLRNRTVREILNEIVRRYRDAAWISTAADPSSAKTHAGPAWEFIFYRDPPESLSQLCCFTLK